MINIARSRLQSKSTTVKLFDSSHKTGIRTIGVSGCVEPLPSRESLNASHIWEQRDSYSIRAKTKDIYDAESD